MSSRGDAGGRGESAGLLVAAEVALSFVLLVGAGLMVATLWNLLTTDVGFRTDRLLALTTSLPDSRYPDASSQAAYFDRVLDRLRATPDVRSVAAVSALPLTREHWVQPVEREGRHARTMQASMHTVSTDYFDTMEIPLLRGRRFTLSDTAAAPPVAIIGRTMARRYWPTEDPIGQALIVNAPGQAGSPDRRMRVEIVGIVGDVRQLGLNDRPSAEWYVPYAQWGAGNMLNEMFFVVRAGSDGAGALEKRARKAIEAVDPEQPLTDVATMAALMKADSAPERFVLAIIGLAALVALMLAACGIWGVVAHGVARRTRELAIRLALGARPLAVLMLVARRQLMWTVGGLAVGMAGAIALTRVIARYLYGVQPTDPRTYLLAALALLVVALAAALQPATRAARIAPAINLRAE